MYPYQLTIIFIKNGVYQEKLRTEQNYITLRGESRDSTIIRFSQLREDWNKNKDYIGPAVINLEGDDIVLNNLTIENSHSHPNFMMLIFPVISMGKYSHTGSYEKLLGENPSQELIEKYSSELQVNEKTPPAFIVHAVNDEAVDLQNSILFYQALMDHNIPASLHIFPHGEYKIGLGKNPGSTALWTELCELWLEEMNIIGESDK